MVDKRDQKHDSDPSDLSRMNNNDKFKHYEKIVETLKQKIELI